MKTLLVLRHAKAGWDGPDQDDHDRTLTSSGKHDAQAMALRVSQTLPRPDQVLVSSAVRTRNTASEFIRAFEIEEDQVVYTKDLYLCSVDEMLDQIAWLSVPESKTILVVGHNPTVSQLVQQLCENTSGGLVDSMQTCSLAVIEFPDSTEWKNLRSGTLLHYLTPSLKCGS
ncbi:MAG: histidine phosphatase family protein [Bradyrhizobiaceae bacterium]|nr:histidine phosphatase family protein [Bradyrhizobiaceae bacterium]